MKEKVFILEHPQFKRINYVYFESSIFKNNLMINVELNNGSFFEQLSNREIKKYLNNKEFLAVLADEYFSSIYIDRTIFYGFIKRRIINRKLRKIINIMNEKQYNLFEKCVRTAFIVRETSRGISDPSFDDILRVFTTGGVEHLSFEQQLFLFTKASDILKRYNGFEGSTKSFCWNYKQNTKKKDINFLRLTTYEFLSYFDYGIKLAAEVNNVWS